MKTGLFSATVAAFIIESYKRLSSDSGDTTVILLTQISQQLAGVSHGTSLQNSNVTTPGRAPFQPTASAIRVNVLWFLSLVLSLTCALSATLLQQWARRYLQLAQRRGAPHERARIRAYIYDGVRGSSMSRAVGTMPMLLHTSVFLFLAGLVDFVLPINKTVAFCILGYIAVFFSVYAILTVLPNVFLNCPYRTPLSELTWRISQVSLLAMLLFVREIEGVLHGVLVSLWQRTRQGLAGLHGLGPTMWRETLDGQIRTRRKWLADGLRRSVVLSATGASWKVDARALHWTLTVLDGDNKIEDFIARIPGFFESPTVPDATSAILALMDVTPNQSDPILGSRLHDLLKTCKPGTSPLVEEARRNRLRVCLKSLWYCARGYNQSMYPAPLPSYVRTVFAVPEMIHQIREEEDLSARIIGRCFGSLVVKKLAQDVFDHPKRYTRSGRGVFVTEAELISLSTLLDTTSKNLMDWLEQKGAIGIANIVSLVIDEAELLVSDKVPSEALDVFQRTISILVKELPHPSTALSDDLALQFCKLFSKVDNAWGTIWLKYQLRPIHERLLDIHSVYSSAWSQVQADVRSHQWGTDSWGSSAVWPRHYARSDETGDMSEGRRRGQSNETSALPTEGQFPLDNETAAVDEPSAASLRGRRQETTQMADDLVS
ncbi:hypothetical protein BJV78DRAFT_1223281 [Lactifluus subvellereus]|nr:hypothetical protein BJV78DRAFT_1223281 [Lactifluus subvellereus]